MKTTPSQSARVVPASSSTLRRAGCCVSGTCAWLLGASLALGGPTLSNTAPASQPSANSISLDQIHTLEADLATYLQRRLDASGPELAMIDYQIDIRLLQRWLLVRSIEPKTAEAMQACIALRVGELQTTSDLIAQQLQKSTKALGAAQLAGLSRLHQLTYKLPEITSVAVIDEAFRSVATALIMVANPAPAEVKNLPPMRPQPLPGPTSRPVVPRTLSELMARAKEAQVSAALKRQLVALATAAGAAAANAKAQEEASSLYDMLSVVIDLSDALEKNTGIDEAARPKVEQQLIEGLALFTDERTRSAGRDRIAALSDYRLTLLRVQRLHLTPALQQKLAPAFVWVNNNPDAGAKVLESLEKFLQLTARAEVHKDLSGLAPNQRKAVDVMQRQLNVQRIGFLDDALQLGNAGALGTSPANLASRIELMRQALEMIDLIEKLPHAMQTLTALRLRPTGGLEKRAVVAIADLSATTPAPTRDASLKFLSDTERLADLSDSLTLPVGLLPDTVKAYTSGRMEGVESRRMALVTDLASQLASSRDLDSSSLSKLETLHLMYDSLRLANDVERGLAKAELLTRWADWSISPAQLRALVSPYRDATAAAFEGFANDNATPLFRWPDVRQRFGPILVLVKEVGLYADQCTDLPTGLPGEFAKLFTPMDNQPFDMERYASMDVGVWQRAAESSDARNADGLFDALLSRLRAELRME